MKKSFFTLLVCLVCLSTYSQTIISNPKFSATTSSYVRITGIEIYDTVTVLNFEVDYFPGDWIRVQSGKTFIEDSNGGEKLYVKRAEGIRLNEKVTVPASGKQLFKLFFPPLNKSTEKIDFEESQWKIFDLEIIPQKHIAIIPEELRGNWLRTDGSNEWMYGLYSNMVVYENEIWDKILVSEKGKGYRVVLQKDNQSRELYLKLARGGNIMIGTDPKKMELFSRDKTFRKDYVIRNDEDFKLPLLKMDTAIYRGYIKGYNPKMGKTGMVYVNDVISQEQNSNIITINPDGTFSAKCFMLYPQIVYVKILNLSGGVFLEPGKTCFHFIDASEFTLRFKNNNQFEKRERKSLFMGECARVNADLQATDSIMYTDYNKIREQILDMNADQYKGYCLDILKKENESLQKYLESNQICKKALTIHQYQYPYYVYTTVFSYNSTRDYEYRVKNKIPKEQKEIPLEREVPGAGFYSFIKPTDLNNQLSLVSGGAYTALINRIEFADCIRPPSGYLYISLSDTLQARGVSLLPEEKELLNKLKMADVATSFSLIRQDTATWNSFNRKYSDIIKSVRQNSYQWHKDRNFKQYFGLTDGFAKEIMFARSMCGRMKGTNKPFSESDKDEIKKAIKTEFIYDYLMQLSKAKEAEIAVILSENKGKTGYNVNATPQNAGDRLFDAIMQKYRGKVVFVDFWATWCAPCRSGIETIKPLKEELKDKDIVFVYITDGSSPEDTWKMMIPDIKGEHYRVNNDEWNYLKSKFKISGIPHYTLVNKDGTIAKNDFFYHPSDINFKKLLDESLNRSN